MVDPRHDVEVVIMRRRILSLVTAGALLAALVTLVPADPLGAEPTVVPLECTWPDPVGLVELNPEVSVSAPASVPAGSAFDVEVLVDLGISTAVDGLGPIEFWVISEWSITGALTEPGLFEAVDNSGPYDPGDIIEYTPQQISITAGASPGSVDVTLVGLRYELAYGPGPVPVPDCVLTQGPHPLATIEVVADEVLTCFGHPVTIAGTPGDDVLIGTNGPDVIHGVGGNNLILGRGGDDIICGGPGNDLIFGGPGNDLIDGGGGFTIIFGGPGRDTCTNGIAIGC
jgi:hypothetical protein